ncbi:carbonate dehydratase [Microsporum canis CBS 113480]|uniref:carbonic anhydrase n=1 Tax=Arthroderma otae (strain ATCC MYA-4605 / CBS 113480) TaxID=554155 RepID=C5FY17_ARTOC|nr:carbonate dehydratase [Microsporum canis CBS 113480]EEQ34415.1 carbonate dehydratase [Microsporum canis CBS 113480]
MIPFRQIAVFVALVTSASASCLYRTDLDPHYLSSDGHVPVSSFNYTGEGGPLHWVGLNPTSNWECGHGSTQSPIVINTQTIQYATKGTVRVDIPTIRNTDFENLGSTVEVVANGTLKVKNNVYKLAQFHFHTPSEHRVDEEYSPMEIHFVFQHVTKIRQLDFSSVVDTLHNNDVYTYMGSLTTPPCTGKVTWYISASPLSLDVATFNNIKKVVKYNSRYTQNSLGKKNLMEVAADDMGCGGTVMREQSDP